MDRRGAARQAPPGPGCRGLFVTIEGADGSGKSTLADRLAMALATRDIPLFRTREPGGTGNPLAEAIRGLALGDWAGGVPPMTELLLMLAGRHAHVAQTLQPALAAGRVVVCDRFSDSTWAYQGARGIADAVLSELEARVPLVPDLTFVLDLPVAESRARTLGRGDENRFDAAPEAYRETVRRRFRERAAAAPERCIVLDARQHPDELCQQAMQAILARWPAPAMATCQAPPASGDHCSWS